MNSKSTWVWFTIAAVLLAAVFGVEKYWCQPPPGLVALLPEFRTRAITSVQFAPSGQLEIRADRTNGTWQLVKPIHYPAQAAAVDTLLQALERLAPAYTIPATELRTRKNADVEFGFHQRNTLTLHTGDFRQQLIIGARTAHGDQLYVQVVGAESVFVVDARLLQLLPGHVDDWRDTGLVDLRNLLFDHLVISNAAIVLHLKQESTNAPWRLTNPLSARADNFRLMELLQQLHTTRVTGFVTDDPRGDLDSYGFTTPELELALMHGTNTVTAVQFGKSPTNDSTLVYARRSGFPTVVTVARQAIEPWFAPLEKFRDPYLITRQRPVDEIEVRGPDHYVLQRVSTNAWKLADSDLPVDAGFVAQMLVAFVAAPIVEFKDSITEADLPRYGLTEPARVIKLRGKPAPGTTNSLIAELAFGQVNANDRVAYVRRADENPVYAISLADHARLSVAPWQLRDRRIWRFSETNVVRVLVRQENRVVDVRRLGENSWTFAAGSQGILNSGAVEEAVRRFGELDSAGWLSREEADREKYGFLPHPLTVTFELKDGTKHVVEFGGQSVDNYPFAAVKLGAETWIFECPLVSFELLKFALLRAGSNP